MFKVEVPITDNHMHLNPRRGLGLRPIEDFIRFGGRNIVLVNLLCRHYGLSYLTPQSMKRVLEIHLKLIENLRQRFPSLNIYAVVGPHPAELTELLRAGFSLPSARRFMIKAIDIAGLVIQQGMAIALGEVGRPHYPVPKDVWDASNEILAYAFMKASRLGKPVQIHMETPDIESLNEIADMAERGGLPVNKVIIHHSPPLIRAMKEVGVIPSITAKEQLMLKALKEGTRFLLESDYLDDPRRPGAVVSPRVIPRKVNNLIERGLMSLEQAWHVNVHLPEKIYGVKFH